MMVALEVARQTLLLQLRSKLYWILLILSSALSCVFLLIPPRASVVEGTELFGIVCVIAAFTLVLPFISLYFSVHAVNGDLEDRTSVYLFTRPIHRVWILLGKWLAVSALGCLFAVVSMTVFYFVVAKSGRPWEDGAVPSFHDFGVFLTGACLSMFGYAAMGCLFAAFFRRPMLIGVVYLVIQQIASRMPPSAGIHSATVAEPTRRFVAENLVNPPREVYELLQERAGDSNPSEIDLGDPLMAMGKLILITMLFAGWIYSRREYDARPRE